MSGFSIKIASSPSAIAEFSELIEENAGGISVSLDQSASHRDFSIVEVALTAVTVQAVGLVFQLLKDFITAKLKKESSQKGFAIEIDGALIEIKAEADLSKLEELEERMKAEAGHAE